MTSPLETIVNEARTLWKPWLAYTVGQTLANGTIIGVKEGDAEVGAADAMRNIPFQAVCNVFYAKGVDYITRRLGKYGRLGASAFSVVVTLAFYGWGRLTNETDPLVPASIMGAVGLYLTNRQVSQIQSQTKAQSVGVLVSE